MIGRLTAVSNNVAVINGRAYPLAIFPDAEQARMRDLLQVPSDLPPALAKRRRALRERYLRNEALLKAGAKTPEAAARLDTGPRVKRVGVFVNQDAEEILEIMRAARLDIAQLHGCAAPPCL